MQIVKAMPENEVAQFSKTPTLTKGYRLESDKGGVDMLLGYKKVGKAEYLTKIEQPYYNTNKGFTLEGGKGTTFRLKDNKLTAVSFETGGRGINLDSSPRRTFGLFSKELPGVNSSTGRLFTRTKSISDLDVTRATDTVTGKSILNAKGLYNQANEYNKKIEEFNRNNQVPVETSLCQGWIWQHKEYSLWRHQV